MPPLAPISEDAELHFQVEVFHDRSRALVMEMMLTGRLRRVGMNGNPGQVEILAIGIKEGKDLIIGGQKMSVWIASHNRTSGELKCDSCPICRLSVYLPPR
jgi:hypothetical protein